MKILIVSPKINIYGGAELLIVRLANYCHQQGHHVSLLVSNILLEVKNELSHINIINLELPNSLNIFSEAFALRAFVKDNGHQFDIINAHNSPAELVASCTTTPVVWMCNEPPHIRLDQTNIPLLSKKRIGYWVIAKWSKMCVNTKSVRTVVSDAYNQGRFKKLYHSSTTKIPYGVDTNFFGVDTVPKPSSTGFHVLQSGMIQPLKNQLKSVETINKIKNFIPEIRLTLAGLDNTDYASTLKDYIKTNNLQDYVIFTGHISREKLKNLFSTCDVLLHPVEPQGGWLTPFEAILSRMPIVVSESLTASDIIADNDLGIVTNDYVDALLYIYNNKQTVTQSAESRRNWVQSNLSWERFSQAMLDTFQEVVGTKSLTN